MFHSKLVTLYIAKQILVNTPNARFDKMLPKLLALNNKALTVIFKQKENHFDHFPHHSRSTDKMYSVTQQYEIS